jgi:predicted RNase H-like HicB family nuclease
MSKKKFHDPAIVKEIKVKGYTLVIYKETEGDEREYKLYAEVKEMGGCFIAGDSEKEILADAPAVIEACLEAQTQIAKQQPKLVSVKMKADLYAEALRYAREQGIENISTLMRSLLVRKMREDGYNIPGGFAVSH